MVELKRRKGKKKRKEENKKKEKISEMASQGPFGLPSCGGKTHGFLTYQALNSAALQVQGVSQRAAKVSRNPQIQMVCSTVYSTLSQFIFSLLGLPQALYTENNVQKMSMRLRGRVKRKTLVI